MQHPDPSLRILRVAVVLSLALAAARVGAEEAPTALGRAGYLIVEVAPAETDVFRWEAGPEPGRKSLIWDAGRLVLPDTLEAEPFGRGGFGVACGPSLHGTGASGALVLADGVFPVSEQVMLTDGVVALHLSAGELEIRGAQLRYRRAGVVEADRRVKANYLFLGGLVLMIVVLLRRARHRRAGSGAR